MIRLFVLRIVSERTGGLVVDQGAQFSPGFLAVLARSEGLAAAPEDGRRSQLAG